MRVLLAMSGGVDSSVAASLLLEQGHDVMGATMKLWGGDSDTGCCSVSDVDDARRVAQQLGIVHHVFAFSDDFDRDVVEPYVRAHAEGLTPNPCVECNRHLKFARFLRRADQLGFDAVATGHHARVVTLPTGRHRLCRAVDTGKDQSYVLHMLTQQTLARTLLPIGELTKDEVRRRAASLGLRTATKPDSQDVCFITTTGGRERFLRERITLHPGRMVDTAGGDAGEVDAVELVTVGQRRRLGDSVRGRRYAVSVNVHERMVTVGSLDDLMTDHIELRDITWVDEPVAPGLSVAIQTSAHGRPVEAMFDGESVWTNKPVRRVAPGQSVVLYDGDFVLGGGLAT
jgi:tRNA-specific 2-thiouridylase